jgi:outer membrane protein OmpA-like peptidoglycan-associated protein
MKFDKKMLKEKSEEMIKDFNQALKQKKHRQIRILRIFF